MSFGIPGAGDRIGASIARRMMKPGTWTPSGGDPVPVRVSFEAPYIKIDALGTVVDGGQAFAGGLATEFADARQGDVLEIGPNRWALSSDPSPTAAPT